MIFGPETWREVRGEPFTYWDRWLLRLAVDDAGGIAGVAAQLEQRRRRKNFYETDAEAKLAQLADLTARLQRLGLEPREVLGEQDAIDKGLIRRAHEKVFKQTGGRFTTAMHDTPRRRLRERPPPLHPRPARPDPGRRRAAALGAAGRLHAGTAPGQGVPARAGDDRRAVGARPGGAAV